MRQFLLCLIVIFTSTIVTAEEAVILEGKARITDGDTLAIGPVVSGASTAIIGK